MRSPDNASNFLAVLPIIHKVISLHPFLPIEKNEDGTGGGFIARVQDDTDNASFVRIEWGSITEIEILQ